MAVKKNGIVVVGSVFVDIKGFPHDRYIPDGRNAGYIEYRHGGVSRNVAEDIANIGLNPSFLGLVDHSALGQDVIERLKRQHVNTEYMEAVPSGMGTWLAVFDNNGDVAGSISQRPDLMPILDILNQRGDEIFQEADAILVEIDIEEEILKKIAELCKKYRKEAVWCCQQYDDRSRAMELPEQLRLFHLQSSGERYSFRSGLQR